jgi:dihydropteridine reductase
MATKNALIYGGSGALGSVLVSFFRQRNWSVLSVDSRANASASDSVILNLQLSWKEQEQQVLSNVAEKLGGKKLDVVICVAGGWAGGNAADDKLVDASELMWKQSVQSSAIAARLSTKYLNE